MAELRNREPRNSWERNLKLFTANPNAEVKPFIIPAYASDASILTAALPELDPCSLAECSQPEIKSQRPPPADEQNESQNESEQEVAAGADFFVPRSFDTLFNKILAKVPKRCVTKKRYTRDN